MPHETGAVLLERAPRPMPSLGMLNALRPLRVLCTLAFTALLAACASPPTNVNFAEMTFRHLQPIELLVSEIKVESTAPQSIQPPNIGHLFPTPPETALRNWARDRLVSRGSGMRGATATFTIVRAEAIRRALRTDTGFTGLFKQELSDRYEVSIGAVLTIYEGTGQRRAHVEAKAEHATTVREDATLIERQKVMYDMTEKMMAEFNSEMERNIRTYLRDFVQ
jgi:hypothetical protein